MGAGGIIQKHVKLLLVAVTDSSFYDSLNPKTKAKVDAVEAKDPLTATQEDVLVLAHAIMEVAKT